jgi:Biotin-requiring enzyme.
VPKEKASGSLVADVVLPQMGLEVSEGTVTAVLVTSGDSVAEGDTVAEVLIISAPTKSGYEPMDWA